MPTTRQRVGHRMLFQLTPQAIAAWQAGDKHACHQALGIMPWDWSPYHVYSAQPPEWLIELQGSDLIADVPNYLRAWSLRTALIQLAGEPGPERFDQHGRPLP